MIHIAVTNEQQAVEIRPGQLRRIARAVLRGEGIEAAEISIALVSNSTMQRLNRKFLGHDWPTDVITFPLSDAEEAALGGEVVVGVETARQMARTLRHSLQAELALYVIHGLLHLCGYDDRRARERRIMREREGHYVRLLGIRLKGRIDA